MDTTEERNGTYFYRGHPNLSKIELLNVIFLEEFCKELGIDSVSGAAILSGQPWLGTRAKPQGNHGNKCCLKVCAYTDERCTHAFWYFCSYTSGCKDAEI